MQQAQPSVLEGLRHALQRAPAWSAAPLEPLQDKGLAHFHVRLAGTGLLARIPKQSQLGLAPAANLAHQQACFARAQASGHTPRVAAVLPPDAGLPRGALLVEEIVGRPARLPADLGALARALASVHRLPLPAAGARGPLADATDPLAELAAEIRVQAQHLPAARLQPTARHLIETELEVLQAALARPDRPSRHLIAFDAHPGNFLLRADGEAVLVDLEKCRYSHPGLDLAHATLYTSTTWDVASRAELSVDEVAACYAGWEQAVGAATADAAKPWHIALRQAMWLWSLTWCCKWRALAGRPPSAPEAGEDWSAQHSDAGLVAHVGERVDHYLAPPTLERMQGELRALARILAA